MAYRFFFFAGGDYREGQGNAFTANFIRYLDDTFGHRFSVIEGIYHPWPIVNVIWALNRAQEPEKYPWKNRIISTSVNQIISDPHASESKLTLVSSSYGSVVAAQAACHLAEHQIRKGYLKQPFNIALGASMVSRESKLFHQLVHYQGIGIIDNIIYEKLQDTGDNSNGIGGRTSFEAYTNALGICFPYLTRKYKSPSFLNTHPVSGHLHRVRAQSVQKAKDFLHTLLIDYNLGGEEAKAKAREKIGKA